MRRLIRRLAFGLVSLNLATIAYAADGAGQDNNTSPLTWILVFLPALLIIVMVFAVFRKSARMTMQSVKASDEYRIFSEAHMRRLESQIENLDKRLVRMIELLEAAEQRQGRELN
jgi:hypothetical protein